MIKAPTKHGLDRKFKPWRRGKSQKANKRSSLKQQLRGHTRLLAKLDETETERRKELKAKIKALKAEIDEKQQSMSEKKNAEKSHGQRFLDRQRLTRLEKKARKDSKAKKNPEELLKIALDQVYVAHHPADVKYMPLFQRGQTRVVDQSRQLYRRAVTRRRILKELGTSNKPAKSWVAADLYKLLPKEWTIQDEERVFGGSISRNGIKEMKKQVSDDSRFQVAQQHEAVLQLADQVEADLDEKTKDDYDDGNSSSDSESSSTGDNEEMKTQKQNKTKQQQNESPVGRDDSGSSSSDDEDSGAEDDADPLKREKKSGNKDVEKSFSRPDQKSVNDSDNNSDSEDDEAREETKSKPHDRTSQPESEGDSSSSSSSSSDSDSDSSDDDNDEADADGNKRSLEPVEASDHRADADSSDDDDDKSDDDSEDDFLMDANDEGDSTDVFERTKSQVPALGEFRGDKSKGWATQRQRPGFKKRRVRR